MFLDEMSMVNCLAMSLRSVPSADIGNSWRTLNMPRMNGRRVAEVVAGKLHAIDAPVIGCIVKQVWDAAISYGTIRPTVGTDDRAAIPGSSCVITTRLAAHDSGWSFKYAKLVDPELPRNRGRRWSRHRMWLNCTG